MKTILSIAAAAAIAAVSTTPVQAHSHKMKDGMQGMPGDRGAHGSHRMAGVKIMHAWARATPGQAANGGAYVTVMNASGENDRLTGVQSDVAKRVEIHTHLNDNGVMRMRKVDGIDVPARGRIAMKPGGYHIMLIGLHKPLQKGESFPVTLVFEKAGELTAEVTVMGVGAMGGGMKHDIKVHGGHGGQKGH
ncbi:MAG: copper chaperone PCu(A)C [Alphaproteobacteria bacterium]